ncbi:hypothetical protein Vadar_034724 [Vaccinium darrowii]|uniref:Uncharacterized protein n=1 Tax=Vaccinium darrowii TaxID=229202 RepID=A0ACB7ZNS7_9ERIC|nr:hypothetical protein Vadar_034724 [Vaccinium darrowii]
MVQFKESTISQTLLYQDILQTTTLVLLTKRRQRQKQEQQQREVLNRLGQGLDEIQKAREEYNLFRVFPEQGVDPEAMLTLLRTSSSVAMDVLSGSVKQRKASKVMRPPKRGQVKARIARSFVKMVSKVISKAVALGRKTRKERKVIAEEV